MATKGDKQKCLSAIATSLVNSGAESVSAVAVMDRINALMPTKDIGTSKGRRELATEISNEFVKEARQEKFKAAVNIQVINDAVSSIKANFHNDLAAGVKALMVGADRGAGLERMSADVAKKEAAQRYLGDLLTRLDAEDMLGIATKADENLQREVFLAGRDPDNPRYSKQARTLARILDEASAERRKDANLSGAAVEELKGRIVRQAHDPYLMRKAAKITGHSGSDEDAWVNFVMRHVDKEATFPPELLVDDVPLADQKGWLRYMYREFITGNQHITGEHPRAPKRLEVSDLALPLEADRVIHFTPEGAYEYMTTFGKGNLMDSVFDEIQLFANRQGVLSTLGLDPYNNLRAIIKTLKHNADPEQVKKLDDYAGHFESGAMSGPMWHQYQDIIGGSNVVQNDTWAAFSSYAQAFEYMTKLGGSSIAAVGDLANVMSDLRFQGKGFFESFVDGFMVPFRAGTAPEDVAAIADSLAVGLEHMLSEYTTRFATTEAPNRTLSRAMTMTFKMNLLGPWTNNARRGLFMTNSNYLASVIDSGVVSKKMRNVLDGYGITDNDLKFLKSHGIVQKMSDGKRYVNPAAIKGLNLSDFKLTKKEMFSVQERVAAESRRLRKTKEFDAKGRMDQLIRITREKKRRSLEKRINTYFLDRNDFGILTPGAETRAMIHRGLPKGDPARVFYDLFWQLKQYPLAMWQKTLKRDLFGSGGNPLKNENGELLQFSATVATLFGFGALIMHLKDLAKGREHFYPETKEEYIQYFARAGMYSGALGLYGDFVFGGTDESFIDKARQMAGPAFNDILDAGNVIRVGVDELVGSGEEDLGAAAWKSLRNDIPFADLWYSKWAFDYGIGFYMAEMMNPGFVERHEAAVERYYNGRGYRFSPSKYANLPGR